MNLCSGSGEGTVEQGLEKVVSLAQRFSMAGAKAFVPGGEGGEALL